MISWVEILFRLTLLKLGMKTKTETTATLPKTLTSQGAWGHLESYPPNSPCSEVRDITIPALQVGKKCSPDTTSQLHSFYSPAQRGGAPAHTEVGMDLGPSSRLLHACIFLETRVSSELLRKTSCSVVVPALLVY